MSQPGYKHLDKNVQKIIKQRKHINSLKKKIEEGTSKNPEMTAFELQHQQDVLRTRLSEIKPEIVKND